MLSQTRSGVENLVERVLTDMRHSAGGVKLISGTERITLDNTLDERLRLLEDRVRYPRFLAVAPDCLCVCS